MRFLPIAILLFIAPLVATAQITADKSNNVPLTAEEWFEFGRLKSRVMGNEEARDAFERAIALKPDYAEAKFLLGVWYLTPKRRCALGGNLRLSKEPDLAVYKAIEALNGAIKLIPNSPAPYEWLGKAYERLGSKSDAVNAYETAILNGSDDLWMHLKLAGLYTGFDRYEDAILRYRFISTRYKELRERKKGETIEQRNDEMSPLDRFAFEGSYNELARLYVQLDRVNDALVTYLQIIELRLNDADTHFELGQLYVRLGDRMNAIVHYEILKRIADAETHVFSKKELNKDARTLLKQIESL